MPASSWSVATPTTGWKTATSPSDDESGAMLRFPRMKTLQKFASVHASVHNLFNQERHLTSRETFKQRRSEALSEWRTVMD